VIPPAWRDVWICPDPDGHIQATGLDDAGRRQYLYHPQWRRRRDRRKFRHVRDVGEALPRLRRRVREDLRARGVPARRILALAVRLLELGLFRVGGDVYAGGDEPTYGVATLRAEHVRRRAGGLTFRYPAKGNIERTVAVTDAAALAALESLRRHRHGDDRLLAWRDIDGTWHDVHSDDINDYLKSASGIDMTAKDLRTWHATVLAAKALARAETPGTLTASRRTVARVVREVAEELGNTPTVARASYIDPDVIERFEKGQTIARDTEAAVRDLLDS
jgi:DNA topoisomerase IB